MAFVYFKAREREQGSIIVSTKEANPIDIIINTERVEGLLTNPKDGEFVEVTMFSGERYILPFYTLEEVADKLGFAER